MQLKKALIIILLLQFCLPLTTYGQTDSVSSKELIENAAYWDEKQINYTGEVIGDILVRGEYAWISVSDGENTMSCVIPADISKEIDFFGRYGVKGDTVCVQGVFNRACVEHGGDMDIHVSSLKKISEGRVLENKYSSVLLNISCTAFIIAVFMVTLVIHKRK